MSINFSIVWDSDYWMKSNDMFCGFNMPEALVSKKTGESEFAHGLPPYAKRRFYLSDEYPACPKNWVPSEGRKTSYFVPVKEDYGMWFDFNKNSNHKYEVAIVISVQGVNPITGMPCTTAGLEQYIDTCPKHNIKFGPHRYCKKCGYKWPKQNYLCTTGTPQGNLWLDGFRTADGVVRQYILTMDKIKGVAANIIKDERVFAVGISFFLSVNPKPIAQQTVIQRNTGQYTWNGEGVLYKFINGNIGIGTASPDVKLDVSSVKSSTLASVDCLLGDYFSENSSISQISSYNGGKTVTCAAIGGEANPANLNKHIEQKSYKLVIHDSTPILIQPTRSVSVKKVEIGAGANIDQNVCDDPETLEFWRKEPESLILINYCLESDCEKILSKGKISLEGHKESFLKDIPTGNDGNEKKN